MTTNKRKNTIRYDSNGFPVDETVTDKDGFPVSKASAELDEFGFPKKKESVDTKEESDL